MSIKMKLLSTSVLTVLGLVALVMLSLYGSGRVNAGIDILVSKSTPLQVKSISLQREVEKLSADLLRLGLSNEEAEAQHLNEEIIRNLRAIEDLQGEINKIKESPFDFSSFKELHEKVHKAVMDKQQNMASFKSGISTVNASLKMMEESMTGLRKTVSQVNAGGMARSSAAISNFSEAFSIANLCKDYAIQLGEVRGSILALELAHTKSEIGLLKRKVKSLVAATQSYVMTEKIQSEFPDIKEVRDFINTLNDEIGREGTGLASLRQAMLTDKKGESPEYSAAKEKLLGRVDNLVVRMNEKINAIETKVAGSRKELESVADMGSKISSIISLMTSIEIDGKYLDSKVRLVMLSDSEAELDRNAAELRITQNRMLGNIEILRKGIAQFGQGNTGNIEAIKTAVQSARGTIDRIVGIQRSILQGVALVNQSIAMVKAVSAKQSEKSEERIQVSAAEQQQMIELLQRTIKKSNSIMVIVSALIIVITLVMNIKLFFAVTGPLGSLVSIVKSVKETGDFSQRVDVKTRDEVGLALSSFNGLLEDIHLTLEKTNEVMHSVSDGDLRKRITEDLRGDLGTLKQNINSSLNALSSALSIVSDSTVKVAAAAEQSSRVVEQVAHGSMEQKDAVTHLAAAVSESSTAITDIAKNTETAAQCSKTSAAAALGGKDKIHEMSRITVQITENNNKINAITGLIQDIADQTNLLALNAAIEAARAGEQGRGFAVVADEVRKLAEKVSHSAREISDLINKAVADSAVASEASSTIQEAMESIAQASTQTQDMLQQIAAAVEEQSMTMSDIHKNVITLNDTAESNAEAAKEITVTVLDLSQLADETRTQVGKFKC